MAVEGVITHAPDYPPGVPQFAGALLGAWEELHRLQCAAAWGTLDRYGEQSRVGATAPSRLLWTPAW